MSSLPFRSTLNFFDEVLNFTMCQEHEYGRIIWGCFSLFFFLLGFPAYIFIFYDWYKKYSTTGSPLTPSAFFNLNLAVMDCVFLVCLPVGMGNHFIWHNWTFESVWNGIYALSVCGRPLIMACICLDCYLAVVHPLLYRNWDSLTPRIAVVVVVWLLTLAFGLAFGLYNRITLSFLCVAPYLVAIVFIIICDCVILYTLKKTGPGGKSIHPQKQRAIQTVVNSFVVSVFSYIPPVFIYTISSHVGLDVTQYYCSVLLPVFLFSTMGSAVMPLLFLRNTGGFDRFKTCCSNI